MNFHFSAGILIGHLWYFDTLTGILIAGIMIIDNLKILQISFELLNFWLVSVFKAPDV